MKSYKTSQLRKISFAILILAVVTMACSLTGGSSGGSTAPPTPTFPVFATQPPLVITEPPTVVTATTDPNSGGGQQLTPFPTSTPSSHRPDPSTNATGTACLPGNWSIDLESVMNYMTQSMLSRGILTYTPTFAGGQILLSISGSTIQLLGTDFSVSMAVSVLGAEATDFDVVMQSNGNANYTAQTNTIHLTSITYNANGVMSTVAGNFSLDFNNLFDLANSLGFATDIPAQNSTKTLSYTCAGDSMVIIVNQYASVVFNRVVQ